LLVDAYGSDTILADADAFSQINGLPAVSDNIEIYYRPVPPTAVEILVAGMWKPASTWSGRTR